MLWYLLSYRGAHKLAYVATTTLPYALLFFLFRDVFDELPGPLTWLAYLYALVSAVVPRRPQARLRGDDDIALRALVFPVPRCLRRVAGAVDLAGVSICSGICCRTAAPTSSPTWRRRHCPTRSCFSCSAMSSTSCRGR